MTDQDQQPGGTLDAHPLAGEGTDDDEAIVTRGPGLERAAADADATYISGGSGGGLDEAAGPEGTTGSTAARGSADS
jgi:hypothetical protein